MNGMNEQMAQQADSSSFRMLRALVGIGVICALLIVLAYEGTLPRVQQLRADALEKAIFRVLPGTVRTQAFAYVEAKGFLPQVGAATGELVYAGYDAAGGLTGLAIAAQGQGYADVIRILYGYDVGRQAVVGMYVLESKETPGLGDKVEKSDAYKANFDALDVALVADGMRLANPVEAVKSGTKTQPWQVDCITGATISSRAIGEMISESTQRWVPLVYEHKADFEAQKHEQ